MERDITKELIENYSNVFLEQFKDSSKFIEKYGGSEGEVEKDNYLPEAFTGKNVSVTSFYSTDREHVFITFAKSDHYKFSYGEMEGNVFNVYDFKNRWQKNSMIVIKDSINVRLSNSILEGNPVDVYGDVEMIIDSLSIRVPYPTGLVVKIEYALVFSKKVFLEKIKKAKNLANDLVLTYMNFYNSNHMKLVSGSKEARDYIKNLDHLKLQMNDYFFSNNYTEPQIDKFIEKNPLIIEWGLGISKFHSQMELRDIHNRYKQNLKPDLIGFDPIEKTWKVVDYKLPGKRVVSGNGTVRASLTSSVHKLQAQLKRYREYFMDEIQRKDVNERYSINIGRFLPAIGVLGTVSEVEREDFTEMRQEIIGWMTLVSYDEIFNRVCSQIDLAKKIS